jgi:hypothetical protein
VAVYGARFLRPGKDVPVGLACPLDALCGCQPKAPKGLLTLALVDAMRQHKEMLPALVETFEARAASLEYDGRIPRAEAERLAWACIPCLSCSPSPLPPSSALCPCARATPVLHLP